MDWPRRLAVAVLARALRDALQPRPSLVRRRAELFLLRNGDGLRWWCELAGVTPERVRRRMAAMVHVRKYARERLRRKAARVTAAAPARG